MKINVFILAILIAFFSSCGPEEMVGEFSSKSFTDSDFEILSLTLNIGKQPFNYANMDLPRHYTDGDASEIDNTPEDNLITDMGATLGRVLFYDKNLSIDNTISCASCHKQELAFSDTARFSLGINGQRTARNSMTIINSRFYENGRFFWDERASSLEEQSLIPIQDHKEMGMELSDLVQKLDTIDYYAVLFRNAFGTESISTDRIAKALSQYMRSIVSINSKFDRGFQDAGFPEDEEQMPNFSNFTAQENLGMDIFYRGRKGGTCLYCHGSPQHVNDEAKNNGLSLAYKDLGKGRVTGNSSENATFKAPSLRNIAKTPPYMHDGRFKTLMEVVNHYSDNVQDHPNLNFRLKDSDDPSPDSEVLRLNLNQEEKEALVAFLHTLTDEEVLTDEKYSDPFR